MAFWSESKPANRARVTSRAPYALRDHRNRPDLRRVGDFVALGIRRATGEDEERLLVRSAKRAGDDAARRRDGAETLAVRAEDHDAALVVT